MATPEFIIKNYKASPVRDLSSTELVSIDVSLDASYCAVMYMHEDNKIYTDIYKYNNITDSYQIDTGAFDLLTLPNVSYNTDNSPFFKAKIVSTSPSLLISYYVVAGSIGNGLEYKIVQYNHTSGQITINKTYSSIQGNVDSDLSVEYISLVDIRNNKYALSTVTRDKIVILDSNFDFVAAIKTTLPQQMELESINFSSDANSLTFFTENSDDTELKRYEYIGNVWTDVTTDIPTADMSGAIQTLRTSNDGKKIVLSTRGNGQFGTYANQDDHFYEISYAYETNTWIVKNLNTLNQSLNVNTYIQGNNSKNSNLIGLSKLGNRIVYLSTFNENGTSYNCHLNYIQYDTAWTTNFDIPTDFEINNDVFENTIQVDPFVVRTYTDKTIILIFTPTINSKVQATMRVLNDEEPPFQSTYTSEIFISATIDSTAGVQTRIENQSTDTIYVHEVNKASVTKPPYYALFEMNPATISNNIMFSSEATQTLSALYDNINNADPTDKYFELDMTFNEADHIPNEYVKFTQIYWTDSSRNAITTLPDFVVDNRSSGELSAVEVNIKTEVANITAAYTEIPDYDERVKLPFTMTSTSTLTRQYVTTNQNPNKFTIVTDNSNAPQFAFNNKLSYETSPPITEILNQALDCSGRLTSLTISDEQLNNIMFALIVSWKADHPGVLSADFDMDDLRSQFNNVIKGIVSDASNIPLQFYVGMRLYNEDSDLAQLALTGCTDESTVNTTDPAITDQFVPPDGGPLTTQFDGTTEGVETSMNSVVVNKKIWTWILFDENIDPKP